MNATNISLARFIQRVQDLDYIGILREANAEAARVERMLPRGRRNTGIDESLRYAAPYYRQQLGRLLFYLQHGRKPAGAEAHEIQQYKILAQSLVERHEYRPEAITEVDRWLAEASAN